MSPTPPLPWCSLPPSPLRKGVRSEAPSTVIARAAPLRFRPVHDLRLVGEMGRRLPLLPALNLRGEAH